jgi:hypothetical protein
LLDAFHSADSRCQFGTQQTGIGGFMRQPTHGGQLLVDGIGSQPARFHVHAVTNDHDAVERQTRL